MHIIAYDPFVPEQRFEKLNAAYCSKLAELLERSDYVSLHVPLNRETRKLIGNPAMNLSEHHDAWAARQGLRW